MKVLSLFDGISCLRISLDQLVVPVTRYVACEIDPYPIKASRDNYPDIEQTGSVIDYNCEEHFDLIAFGSPCQGFSKGGQGLNFEDSRSKLFFEAVRILNQAKAINPDIIFIMENVMMKQEWQDIISDHLGVCPIRINSSLVTAQNRDRLYWTNISNRLCSLFGDMKECTIPQPEDKGIILIDILEQEVHAKYKLTDAAKNRIFDEHRTFGPKFMPSKTGTITTANNAARLGIDNGTTLIPVTQNNGVLYFRNKATCLDASYHKGPDGHGRRTFILGLPRGKNKGSQNTDKSPAITGSSWQNNNFLAEDAILRRLTPLECERLQGIPDGHTKCLSDTRRYHAVGNAWTIPVINHILKHHTWTTIF